MNPFSQTPYELPTREYRPHFDGSDALKASGGYLPDAGSLLPDSAPHDFRKVLAKALRIRHDYAILMA